MFNVCLTPAVAAMLGVRLEPELEDRLARLARQQQITKSELAREAIRRYVDAALLDEQEIARQFANLRGEAFDDAAWLENSKDWK